MPTIIEIQDYLQNLTKRKKITFADIAKGLGTGRSNISLRAKNNSELTLIELKRLEKYFNVDLLNKLNNLKNLEESGQDDFVDVPIRGEVSAPMGTGMTVYNENQTGVYKVSPQLLHDIGASRSSSEIIFAEGDSMTPTIEGGDSLLIDQSKIEIHDGKIYCVRIDGQLYAKRLQKIPPHTIKVISDNKEKYDPFYIDFSKEINFDFAVIGEVKWWGRVAR